MAKEVTKTAASTRPRRTTTKAPIPTPAPVAALKSKASKPKVPAKKATTATTKPKAGPKTKAKDDKVTKPKAAFKPKKATTSKKSAANSKAKHAATRAEKFKAKARKHEVKMGKEVKADKADAKTSIEGYHDMLKAALDDIVAEQEQQPKAFSGDGSGGQKESFFEQQFDRAFDEQRVQFMDKMRESAEAAKLMFEGRARSKSPYKQKHRSPRAQRARSKSHYKQRHSSPGQGQSANRSPFDPSRHVPRGPMAMEFNGGWLPKPKPGDGQELWQTWCAIMRRIGDKDGVDEGMAVLEKMKS